MITEKPGLLRRFGKSLSVIGGLHALIFAGYLGLTLVPGTAQAVTVIMPDDGLRAALPANVSVIYWDKWTAQLASNDPNFVQELYKAGAMIVLPTLDAFCISLG
jgi:hypothetical protein